MIAISIPVQETDILLATILPLGISELALGIIVAIVFGCILLVVKCGRQCCDNVKWIIEICKMNAGKKTDEKIETVKTDSSIDEFSKEEIEEIKEEISSLSQQIKTILADIKQVRKTQVMKALEDDIRTASTEYAMKFEIKRPEYDKAMRILQVTLAQMPEEAFAYKQKVNEWINKAQEKFINYSPEYFEKKVEAVKAKNRST